MLKHIGMAALVIELTMLAGVKDAAATPPQVTVEHFHGLAGLAIFGSFDGCLFQEVKLVAIQNRTRTHGGTNLSSDDVTIEYTVANFCTVGVLAHGSGSGTATIHGSSQRMSFHGSIPVLDDFAGNTTVEVDVTLTKASAVEREVENTHTSTPTSFMVLHSVSTDVTATASGTAILGGTDLLAGLTSDATIANVRSGTLTITRP